MFVFALTLELCRRLAAIYREQANEAQTVGHISLALVKRFKTNKAKTNADQQVTGRNVRLPPSDRGS
jgi:hypothetical protein